MPDRIREHNPVPSETAHAVGKAFGHFLLSARLTCRIQNPDIARAGRDGAAHSGTAGRVGDGQNWTPTGLPTGRFAQETTVSSSFQGIEDNSLELVFGSTNKRNPT